MQQCRQGTGGNNIPPVPYSELHFEWMNQRLNFQYECNYKFNVPHVDSIGEKDNQ